MALKVELVDEMWQFICLATGKPVRFYSKAAAIECAKECTDMNHARLREAAIPYYNYGTSRKT